LSADNPTQTQLGQLTALPTHPIWFRGRRDRLPGEGREKGRGKENEKKKREGEGREEGKGESEEGRGSPQSQNRADAIGDIHY